MQERRARCGKPLVASNGRRALDQIVQSELRQHRATQYTCQRTILVELSIDVSRRVFDLPIANAACEDLDERALMPIVPRCCMTLKHARCYRLPLAAHVGL